MPNDSRPLLTLTLCLSAWLTSPAGGDTLTMNNGDTITGTVVKKEGDILRFNTAYAGTLRIDWTEVRDLQMDEPTEILLTDDTLSHATAVHRGEETVRESGAKAGGLRVPAEDVATIKPEAWDLGSAGKFSGKVNLAAKIEGGNTDKDEIDADFELAYRRSEHRLRAEGQLEFDKNNGETIKQDWFLLGKYDYFFTEQAYYTVAYSLKQEKFSNLQLRQFGGPGIGYQFFTGPPINLLSELSLGIYHEEYVDGGTNSFLGPNWYLKYERELFNGKLKFYHRHLATLNAEDTNKRLWHSWTGFSVPLFGGVIGSTEMEVDHDSNPASDAETTDTTFRLKLGYEW